MAAPTQSGARSYVHSLIRKAHDTASHLHEAVGGQGGHRFLVQRAVGARSLDHEAECRRAPLAERALEGALLAARFVPPAPRRALGRQWTCVAARYAREADRGAEIHERMRGG